MAMPNLQLIVTGLPAPPTVLATCVAVRGSPMISQDQVVPNPLPLRDCIESQARGCSVRSKHSSGDKNLHTCKRVYMAKNHKPTIPTLFIYLVVAMVATSQ